MSSMMFYERPIALNREQHRQLRLEEHNGDFSFTRATNSLLLAVSEISEAAKDYPIVFVGAVGGPFVLAALVGLDSHQNLMLDQDGRWESGTYVPAFARRYPFVLAESPDDPADLTVCIDEACATLNQDNGAPLFDAEGVESEALRQRIAFLKVFHGDMQQTRQFAESLAKLDLLEAKTVSIVRDGGKHVLDGFFVVNQDKLNALGDAELAGLARSGALYCVHAHLLSLSNVERLAIRLGRRNAAGS